MIKVPCGTCHKCCIETEMPLTKKDIRRIRSLGYKDFYINDNGIYKLKNINGMCIFLSKEGCRIYAHRPLGCRLYPLVYDGENVVLDDLCPKINKIPKDSVKRYKKLLLNLVKEIYGIRGKNV